MASTAHTHRVTRWHGVWACEACPAAWQHYRMIPVGSLVALAVFRVNPLTR